MIVIKLGGSLATSGKLNACLDRIEQAQQGSATIIVPGGGLFADQVRLMQEQWQFDDRTAHQMAILSMQQMALAFKARKPKFKLIDSVEELQKPNQQAGISIWSPTLHELDQAGIPSSWEMTSDSLSAWLAKTLAASELIVVKAVKIEPNFEVLKLVQQQIVDALFYNYTNHVSFKLSIINAEKFISS